MTGMGSAKDHDEQFAAHDVHADLRDPRVMLRGRMLDTPDIDVLADLDKSLRWARDLFSAMSNDPRVRAYLKRTASHYLDEIELFEGDEAAQAELCWLWECVDE